MPCQRSAGIARLPLSLEPCGSLAVPQARLDRNRQGRGREGGCLTDHKVCRRGLAEFLRARCLNSGRIHPPLAKSGLAQAKGQKGIVGMGGGETRREEAAMAAMPNRHCLVKQLSCCRRLLGPEWKGRQRERKEPQSSDGLIRTDGGREAVSCPRHRQMLLRCASQLSSTRVHGGIVGTGWGVGETWKEGKAVRQKIGGGGQVIECTGSPQL